VRAAALLIVCAVALPAAAQPHKPWSRPTGNRPTWPTPAAGPSVSGEPELLLTFDDGPHETFTGVILDELKKRNIKAIFFWVSQRMTKPGPKQAARQAIIDRAIREGHVIGNHTVTHPHLCRAPSAKAAHEIDENRAVFGKLTRMPVVFFRAPFGDHCQQLKDLLAERRLRHLHWDIDPMEFVDRDGIRASGTLRRHITQRTRRNERAVVLVHEIHASSAQAITLALQWLDGEQARRRAAGEPEIRMLSGSDLAREQMDPALAAWVRDTGATAAGELRSRLLGAIP
jgi:peptidoglycan/xylan/chitin deacetylase (PgdA/CDA1 family)